MRPRVHTRPLPSQNRQCHMNRGSRPLFHEPPFPPMPMTLAVPRRGSLCLRRPACRFGTRLAVACALVVGTTSSFGHAEPGRLRIRGEAVLRARATFVEGDGGRVWGELVDELGSPLANMPLLLRATLPARSSAPLSACSSESTLKSLGAQWQATTDSRGRFCARLTDAEARRAILQVRFERTSLYDGAERRLELDPSRRQVELRLPTPPREIARDGAPSRLQVQALLVPAPAPGEPSEALPFEVLLTPPAGPPETLLSSTLQAEKTGEVTLAPPKLTPPGPASLKLRCAATPGTQATDVSAPILVTSIVQLAAEGTTAAGPGRFNLQVRATAPGGLVPLGSVEASTDEGARSVAALRAGQAALVVSVEDEARSHHVTLRFIPGAAGWLAGPTPTVSLPAQPASRWKVVGWGLASLAALLTSAFAWRRPRRLRGNAPRGAPQRGPSSTEPSMVQTRRGPPEDGWSGVVRDAHTADAVPHANVILEVPAVSAADSTLDQVATDAGGAFRLAHRSLPAGARLRITASGYAPLSGALPPPGSFVVTLVTHRRAALMRLVQWARRTGAPWTWRTEPTPAQIVELAQSRHQEDIATWAEGVQRSAYAPDDQGGGAPVSDPPTTP